MNMKYYVVDAFTEELFKGNPAGVCLVDEFPTDETMTNIAAENRLSETAFVKHKVDGIYRVRFFTPTSEVDLCGHATLGTGFVLANFVEPGKKEFHLRANQDDIVITVREGGLYEIEFPKSCSDQRNGRCPWLQTGSCLADTRSHHFSERYRYGPKFPARLSGYCPYDR